MSCFQRLECPALPSQGFGETQLPTPTAPGIDVLPIESVDDFINKTSDDVGWGDGVYTARASGGNGVAYGGQRTAKRLKPIHIARTTKKRTPARLIAIDRGDYPLSSSELERKFRAERPAADGVTDSIVFGQGDKKGQELVERKFET